MKKTKRMAAAACLLAVLFGGSAVFLSFQRVAAVNAKLSAAVFSQRLIIDAGHGGFDGGATGTNGVLEKDLNLAIAKKTASVSRLMGFSVEMIREEDTAVCDDGLATLREKKVSDIHNRLKTAQSEPEAIFLSIHQNFYPQPSCCGTQVFYSGNHPDSEKLAQSLQKGIASRLQQQNSRAIKKAEKNLYILYHAQNPALLLECGFLSNPEECERLCDAAYQQQLAFCTVCSLLEGMRIASA